MNINIDKFFFQNNADIFIYLYILNKILTKLATIQTNMAKYIFSFNFFFFFSKKIRSRLRVDFIIIIIIIISIKSFALEFYLKTI